ncbi:MAG: tetratricopeptide repeat protein [Planctomycetota bacterium]|jgi:tetratricopeptide (TPR) repeat protein
MNDNRKRHLVVGAVIVALLSFSLHGCGESDVGKLREELKEEKAKREENSRKYKEALNKLAKARKRVEQQEELLLALGEKLEGEGRSLSEELSEFRKKKEEEGGGLGQEVPPNKAADKLVALGNDFYDKGDYAAAIEVYTSATEMDSEDVDLYLGLGRSYIKVEEYDNAIPIYEKVVRMLGKHGSKEELRQAYNNLGWLYSKRNRYNEAELAYLRAIKADPDYSNTYYNLGLLYDLHLDDELGAIEAYERHMALGGQRSNAVRKRLKEIRER